MLAIYIINKIAFEYEHIDEDYSLRFGHMIGDSHELIFEHFLNKESLETKNPSENLFELINLANTDLYIEIVGSFKKEDIFLK